jgi:hypothetical protein
VTRVKTVFDAAVKHADIPKLIEIDEIDTPDEKTWILYLSFYYLALEPGNYSKVKYHGKLPTFFTHCSFSGWPFKTEESSLESPNHQK